MKVGDRTKTTRRFSSADFSDFSALCGAEAVTNVPGPLLAALISYLLGVKLPGPGTNYLKQDLTYLAPAPLDTDITATVEITLLRPESRLVDLWARCTLPDGTVICEGRALVKAGSSSV